MMASPFTRNQIALTTGEFFALRDVLHDTSIGVLKIGGGFSSFAFRTMAKWNVEAMDKALEADPLDDTVVHASITIKPNAIWLTAIQRSVTAAIEHRTTGLESQTPTPREIEDLNILRGLYHLINTQAGEQT